MKNMFSFHLKYCFCYHSIIGKIKQKLRNSNRFSLRFVRDCYLFIEFHSVTPGSVAVFSDDTRSYQNNNLRF